MDRIFASLASFAILHLLLAAALGLALHAAGPRDVTSEAAISWYRMHFMAGLAVGLAVVLVNCLAVIWFIGTSRWCKEVSEAYSLDRGIAANSNRMKRAAFPYALANMLIIVGVLCLGGAADPRSNIQTAPPGGLTWAQWHLLGAVAAMVAITAAFVVLWRATRGNQQIIQQVLARVEAIRRERGLDTNSSA